MSKTLLALFAVLAAAAARAQPLPIPLPKALAEVADIKGDDAAGLWHQIDIDTNTERAFIGRQHGISVIDLKTMRMLPNAMPGQDIRTALPLPNGRLLATSASAGTATILDQAGDTPRVVIGHLSDPDAAMVEPQTGDVMVVEAGSGVLTVIDPQAGTTVASIHIGGRLGMVQAEGTGRVWITVTDRDQVALVDLTQRRVVSRYSLAGCQQPDAMDVVPVLGRLVIACANGVAKVLSAVDGKDLGTIDVGADPGGVMFADAKAWVPSASGRLTAISLVPTAALAARYRTRPGARTGAFDELSRRFYLPYGDIIGQGDKEALKPGSFGILVLQGK